METPTRKIIDKNLHDQITALNSEDQSYYPVDKLDAHVRNIPHVAISIFVFQHDLLLLQKRAETKYHSGGLWANTVCSHPRWEESAEACAHRRLQEELGWTTSLREFGLINYAAMVGDLYENEKVHCFVGEFDPQNDVNLFNREEVADVDWLSFAEITQRIEQQPEIFTEWFKIYMAQYLSSIDTIRRYNDKILPN